MILNNFVMRTWISIKNRPTILNQVKTFESKVLLKIKCNFES